MSPAPFLADLICCILRFLIILHLANNNNSSKLYNQWQEFEFEAHYLRLHCLAPWSIIHLLLSMQFYEFTILKFICSFVCNAFTIDICFLFSTPETVTSIFSSIYNMQRNHVFIQEQRNRPLEGKSNFLWTQKQNFSINDGAYFVHFPCNL